MSKKPRRRDEQDGEPQEEELEVKGRSPLDVALVVVAVVEREPFSSSLQLRSLNADVLGADFLRLPVQSPPTLEHVVAFVVTRRSV